MKKIKVIIIVLFVFVSLFIILNNKKDKVIIKTNNSIDIIENVEQERQENKKTLKKTNNNENDIIGTIKIDGTNINNSIVQTSNNDFYLNHNIKKQKDVYGSIFLDYRNKIGDRKYLIYGHNSKTLKNALFHDLEKFINESFYKNNKYIELYYGNNYSKWEIFSVMIIEKNNNTHTRITFNDKEFEKHIEWMEKSSLYNTNVDVSISDIILTLQTCYYEPHDSYLLINAKKI